LAASVPQGKHVVLANTSHATNQERIPEIGWFAPSRSFEQVGDGQLKAGLKTTLLINGAAGGIGSTAVQLAVAGSGVLPELIDLAGGPQNVMTLADFDGSKQYGVHFSNGYNGKRARSGQARAGNRLKAARKAVSEFPACRDRRPKSTIIRRRIWCGNGWGGMGLERGVGWLRIGRR
jgi:hypothetical protein